MESKNKSFNFNNNIITKVPTCCLIEDYWMLRSALDDLLKGNVSGAIETIRNAAQCISDTIEECTEVPPGLNISPSVSSAIAVSCESGIIMDGDKDLQCAAGRALSNAGCLHCEECEHKNMNECDPESGAYLLKGHVMYDPLMEVGGEAFVKNLEEKYPCDSLEKKSKDHPLVEIKLPFGTIYIEGKDEAEREEPSRVKIYDSEKRYFEYIEYADDEVYDDLLTEIRNMTIVTELLSFVGHNCGYRLTKDWTVASDVLSDEEYRYDSPEALLSNEWVNKIGDMYIVFED